MTSSKQKFTSLICFAIGLVLGAAVVYYTMVPEITETVEITEDITTDVSYVKVDTVINNEITEEHLVETIAPEIPEERFDSSRVYTGTNRVPYGMITWKAKTGGVLQDLDFETTFDIPVVTNTVTRKERVTREIHRPSLYLTGTYESDKTLSAGLIYTRKKLLVGYKYNLTGINPTMKHSFTVGFRIK